MDIIRLCAWGYAALLGFVILTGYIPAFIDANDMIFGLFRRTWYADGLHLVSALWAAAAALTSRRASELFFQLFGAFYFADGVLGLLTGSGYLDFGILINGVLNLPLSTRIFRQRPASRARRRRDPDWPPAGAADARRRPCLGVCAVSCARSRS